MAARQAFGDFDIPGFSCHDPFLALQVVDRLPEFKIIMLPYNFHNRRFEEAFTGYTGSASFIAMKPLVWLEYGIPFCAINALPEFRQKFGFDRAPDASTHALLFARNNPLITTVISAVNSPDQLENVIAAGNGSFTDESQQVLEQYRQSISQADNVPLYLGALCHDNLRMNYFGAAHLARVFGVKMPNIPLNELDSQRKILQFAAGLMVYARDQGYNRYLEPLNR